MGQNRPSAIYLYSCVLWLFNTIRHFCLQINKDAKEAIWFSFQKAKYIWDGEERKQFVGLQFPVDLQLRTYAEWRGYQEDADLAAAEQRFGKNELVPTRFLTRLEYGGGGLFLLIIRAYCQSYACYIAYHDSAVCFTQNVICHLFYPSESDLFCSQVPCVVFSYLNLPKDHLV